MAQGSVAIQSAAIDDFVKTAIQQYRQKLLDLSSRNPLVNFRHSDRSRSHIRVIDEVPEKLFELLTTLRQLTFEPLPEPELIPSDESLPLFQSALRRAREGDKIYRDGLDDLGPNASLRQREKVEREFRNRVRVQLGLTPYEATRDPKRRAAELGISSDFDLPRPNSPTRRRHNGKKIQTLFFREDLNRKVGALRESARVLLQDAGLSALYCALGFLEYYESENSDEQRVAPLVFFPIELDRELEQGEYRYFIQGKNEDIEVNVALKELLRQQYAIELPEWMDDEEDQDPLGSYLAKVEQLILGRRDWKVRRFVTVGLFTFSTLAMYKDLDPQRWPLRSQLHGRSVLRTLIAGAEVHGSSFAPDYDVDELNEPETLLITDADSSQHSAVVDVLRGKNIVIQGPPGTGKSQTITNIIAAALNGGKSVLFVAEKMAALEVVKKRLDAAGLDPFCLELHSSKTSKTAVVQSLTKRLEYRGKRTQEAMIQSNLDARQKARAELIYYVQKSNEPAGSTGMTVRDVLLGSATRDHLRVGLPPTMATERFGNALSITPHMKQEMLAAAANLERQMEPLKLVGRLSDHPWRGFQNTEVTDLDIDYLLSQLLEWQRSLDSLLNSVTNMEARTGSALPRSPNRIAALCSVVDALPAVPTALDDILFRKLSSAAARDRLKKALQCLHRLISELEKLRLFVDDPWQAMNVGSGEAQSACDAFIRMHITEGTFADLCRQLAAWKEKCSRLQSCETVAATLTEAFGLPAKSLNAIRVASIGVEQLRRLPRDLWHCRDAQVLDERNTMTLEKGAKLCANLLSRRVGICSKWDLGLLPPAADLKDFVIALRTTNWLTGSFNAKCRFARKLAKVARIGYKKIDKECLARDLAECAQYLEDERRFLDDTSIKVACGMLYDGLKTEFNKILALSSWGEQVRQLAAIGENGRLVRQLLFEGSTDKLQEILSVAADPSYETIWREVVPSTDDPALTIAEIRQVLWDQCIHVEEKLSSLADMRIRESVPLSDIQALVQTLKSVESQADTMKVFTVDGDLFSGRNILKLGGEVEVLQVTLDHAHSLAVATVPSTLQPYLFADSANLTLLKSLISELRSFVHRAETSAVKTNALAKLDALLWCGQPDVGDADISVLIDKNRRAGAEYCHLQNYINFLLAEDAASDAGIGPVLAAFMESSDDYHDLVSSTEFVFYRSAAEQVLNADPRLRGHSGATHDQLRSRYQKLDKEYLTLRRQLLADKLINRPVLDGNCYGRVADLTELALIQHLSGQTRPRIALRDLFRRAGRAVKALAPCWMMSPMSVAQFLEPGGVEFDLLLMDEASQIRPEEALGSIARTAQVVVVGDQMQLPPTPFFQKLSADGSNQNDDEEVEDVKQESILEAAAARFYPPRRLKWHYRSEHGSLISFSNHEFYNDDLTVFPSPYHEHPDYGVKLVNVGGTYGAGVNPAEMKAVVQAAADFMAATQDQSLGIVAVNSKQAELIREAMDHLFASEPEAESYRAKWADGLEPLFVKNLENVQGDERDVIFISTVYGKDEAGNFYQRFGPINSHYGHRRLNVLFTRAKKKIIIFSSMNPEDIEDEGKNWGVRALKGYLEYARSGHLVESKGSQGECDSEFESWVVSALQNHGFEAVTQFGFAGYRVDIAVRNAKKPGTFLCGIECDGATYHSARSVRERDRLRQEILERLGWKIYRIWSTDWFRNPSLQTKNLIRYLQALNG